MDLESQFDSYDIGFNPAPAAFPYHEHSSIFARSPERAGQPLASRKHDLSSCQGDFA